MEDVGTLKAEREVIEKELKDPITDIGKAMPIDQFSSVYSPFYCLFVFSTQVFASTERDR